LPVVNVIYKNAAFIIKTCCTNSRLLLAYVITFGTVFGRWAKYAQNQISAMKKTLRNKDNCPLLCQRVYKSGSRTARNDVSAEHNYVFAADDLSSQTTEMTDAGQIAVTRNSRQRDVRVDSASCRVTDSQSHVSSAVSITHANRLSVSLVLCLCPVLRGIGKSDWLVYMIIEWTNALVQFNR